LKLCESVALWRMRFLADTDLLHSDIMLVSSINFIKPLSVDDRQSIWNWYAKYRPCERSYRRL